MNLRKTIVALVAAAGFWAAAPSEFVSNASVNQVDASINKTAKKYQYGGVTALYKMLRTEQIKYNCFYAHGNKIKYRKNGKPEGIVIHETATPGATAHDEAIYFNREWQKVYAYVHAFVDHTGVIQMMTTNYGVWGAGPQANNRFIQVELAEETSRAHFARSVNNDAIFAADMLLRYNLKPNNAAKDGRGTIWSHHAVSTFLGGTDHTDPDGYFSRWGYSMSQFYALVKYYYNLKSNRAKSSTVIAPATADSAPAENTAASGKVLLMHDSYVYDKKGKKVSATIKPAGTKVNAGITVKINGRKYFRIGDNKFVVASNITAHKRRLTHNAYTYDTAGQRIGTGTLSKSSDVKTYGGQVTINGIKFYQINTTQFVKAANFK